MSHLSKWKGV